MLKANVQLYILFFINKQIGVGYAMKITVAYINTQDVL